MKQTTQRVLRKLVNEIVSDGASNWGGWQGGFPGSGSPLKGMKGGGDVGKIQKYQDVARKPKRTNASWQAGGNFKLSGKKTAVIVSPTLQQSANKIDTKNATIAPTDMPPKSGKSQTVRQVKEDLANEAVRRYRMRMQTEGGDILGNLIAKGAAGLAKRLFKKAKPTKTATPKVSIPKPPKPPTQKQQKQADLDASNAKFDAWKKKKGDMARVFKQANDLGLDHDINTPYKSFKNRQDSKVRLANPLKQPNDPPPVETPAAPTTNTWSVTSNKPRVRVKAVSQRAEQFHAEWNERSLIEWKDDLTMFKKPSFKMPKVRNKFSEDAPTNNIGSGNISGFDPILSASVLKRRKKSK